MKKWSEKTLGEFVSLQRGHDLPTSSRGKGNIPVVGSFGITGYHDVAKAKGPGVTVGRSGASAGTVVYVEEDYWPHNTCLFVKDFQGNNPRFAYYLLSTLDLASHAAGSAQPSLNRNHIAPLPLYVPERPEQDDIAAVLSALDDKIELNRRINETLEALAQAIFKDWFVDFGPTRRKTEGATSPVAILGGLIPDPAKATPLAALFPDSFGEDGLPEGWEERAVGMFAKLKGGKQLPKKDFCEDGIIPVYGGAGYMGQTDKHNASGYVISVGRVGAYCGNFVAHRGKAWINNNASFFELKQHTKPEWFFYALKQLDLAEIRRGAAQPFVSNGDIAKLKLIYPKNDLILGFQSILVPLVKLIEANDLENRTLAETCDYLLPKLMSGAVRVRDAEKMVP